MMYRDHGPVASAIPSRANAVRLASCLVVVLSLHANRAGAISDGVPDKEHPNVGALLVEWDPVNRPDELQPECSGFLLSPSHFLTSAHCLVGVTRSGLGPENVAVTFDQNALAPTRVVRTTGFVVHPKALQRRSDADDVAVLILAEHISDVDPADLPTEGFLDQAAAGGGLVDHSFTNVGYGVVPNDRQRPAFEFDGARRVSTSPYKGLTPAYLLLNMRTDATGEGGSCYGDSGAPKFFEPDPGALSNLVLAISSGGDRYCRAHNFNQRLDIPSVRNFLDDFAPVP